MHPALALAFVIPFIPRIIVEGLDDDDRSQLSVKKFQPLLEFGESVEGFVDFIVLFSFGLTNGGVQVDEMGLLTLIIVLSLGIGKVMGISATSALATCAGYPPPAGVGVSEVFLVGMVASIGLTVALFVSGEAFPYQPKVNAQAKMGALLSIFFAPLALAARQCVSITSQDDCSIGKRARSDSGDSDRSLDIDVAQNILANRRQINHVVHEVERKKHVSRNLSFMSLQRLQTEYQNRCSSMGPMQTTIAAEALKSVNSNDSVNATKIMGVNIMIRRRHWMLDTRGKNRWSRRAQATEIQMEDFLVSKA